MESYIKIFFFKKNIKAIFLWKNILIRENVETYLLLCIFGGPHTKKERKRENTKQL
jgi:hypothetical protein